MSDDLFSIIAALSALASAGALWLRFRRRRLLRRFLSSLDEAQLRALKDHLQREDGGSAERS